VTRATRGDGRGAADARSAFARGEAVAASKGQGLQRMPSARPLSNRGGNGQARRSLMQLYGFGLAIWLTMVLG
jgi:hypothetical protein